nr:AraC family transcriptional regulator N-terminal domain-containing protein [uncultured Desulfobulbus sp.]
MIVISSGDVTSYMMEPSICLIAQGRKRVMLGDEEYQYDKDHYLVSQVDFCAR